MIHAICDFCGKDCDRTATLLSMTPFQNFARYHTDNEPYGRREKTRSFVIFWMMRNMISKLKFSLQMQEVHKQKI